MKVVAAGRHIMEAPEPPPAACALDLRELGPRLAWIQQVTQRALLEHQQDDRALRLTYRLEAAEELQRIVALEQSCCAFLKYSLKALPTKVVLTIEAPQRLDGDAQWLFAQFLPAVPSGPAALPSCACGAGDSCR